MTAPAEHKSHVVLYVVAGIILLVLAGVGLFTYHGAKESQRAQEKATQLSLELSKAGMRVPTTDQIARVLGDDGGATCADPGSSLRRGVLYGQLTNGAAGPGQRPVIADNTVVKGQLLIIKVYCPEHLEQFQQIVDDLKFADVAVAG